MRRNASIFAFHLWWQQFIEGKFIYSVIYSFSLSPQILKYTPENHFDRLSLETALEKAEELCQQVNEGVRNQENTDRLEWLQTHVNLESIGEVCTAGGRPDCFSSIKRCYCTVFLQLVNRGAGLVNGGTGLVQW